MTAPGLAIDFTEYLLAIFCHAVPWIGGVWLLTRLAPLPLRVRERLWKLALLAPLVTAGVGGLVCIELTAPLPSESGEPSASSSVGSSRISPSHDGRSQQPRPVESESSSSPRLPSWPTCFGVAWFTLTVLSLSRLVVAAHLWRRRLGHRHPLASGLLLEELECLRSAMKIGRAIRVTTSSALASPIALGRSEICVPPRAAVSLERAQLRALLAHELAHLERGDRYWLWIGAAIERAFLFQPLFRWAHRELCALAEFACDQEAAKRTDDPVVVAHCLAEIASWIESRERPVRASAFASRDSLLVSRVRRLIQSPVEGRAGLPVLACATVIAVLAVIGSPRISIEGMPEGSASAGATLGADETPGGLEAPRVAHTGWLVSDAGLKVQLRNGEIVSATHHGQPIPEGRRLIEPEGIRFLSARGQDLGLVRTGAGELSYDLTSSPERHFVFAEDPAGTFSLEYDGDSVKAVYLDNRQLAPERWSSRDRRLQVLRKDGQLDFEVELKPSGGISWSPRYGRAAHGPSVSGG